MLAAQLQGVACIPFPLFKCNRAVQVIDDCDHFVNKALEGTIN